MGCTSVFCASCASEEVVLGVEAAVLPAVELEAPQPAMVIPSAKSTVNVPILWFHLIRKPSFSCLTERFRSATIKTNQEPILLQLILR